MAANPDRSLADVLEPVGGWLAAIPAQSRALGARFVTDCLAPRSVAPSLWVLPRFDLRLRLGLTVSEDRRILLFFQDETGDVPVFKSETRFQVGPVAEAAPELPARVEELPCVLRLPAFILARTTTPVQLQFGSAAEEVLEIWERPGDPERPRIRVQGRELREGDPWPLAPFLALVRRIREWASGQASDGPDQGVLPLRADEPREVRQVLFQMLEGWRQVQSRLTQAEPPTPASSPPSLAECLATPYGLQGFSGEVDLRLRPNGTLAKADDDDTTQVRLRLEVADAGDGWRGLITACPPDFLVEGPVFDAVRKTFADELGSDLEEVLADAGVPAFEPEIARLIRSGGENSVLMRVSREGNEDTDLFVLTGDLIGYHVALLLKGEFELKPDGSGEVDDWDDLEVLYAGPLRNDAAVADKDAQESLRRLAVVAQNWLKALP